MLKKQTPKKTERGLEKVKPEFGKWFENVRMICDAKYKKEVDPAYNWSEFYRLGYSATGAAAQYANDNSLTRRVPIIGSPSSKVFGCRLDADTTAPKFSTSGGRKTLTSLRRKRKNDQRKRKVRRWLTYFFLLLMALAVTAYFYLQFCFPSACVVSVW